MVPRDVCLLLTGTPLHNFTEELWAFLNFADSDIFESKEVLVENFGKLIDTKQVSELHIVLRPYFILIMKDGLEKLIPPKEDTILEVAPTTIQNTYYKAIYEKNNSFLFKGAKTGNAPRIMNVMMEHRK